MPHKSIDGYVSVTQVINCLDKPWRWAWYQSAVKKNGWNGWLECNATSEKGMEEGTAFHTAIEKYLLNHEPLLPMYGSWQTWYETNKPNAIVIEPQEPYKCPSLKLSGTPDFIAEENGYTVVYDWKNSKTISETWGLQLAAYSYLYGWDNGLVDKKIWENSPKGKVVWLNKTNGSIKEVTYQPLKRYWKVFRGLLDAYNFLHGINEWKK